MASEQISSQKNFLKAQSDYNSAQAQYSGLKKQLELININPKNLHFNNISSVVSISLPIDGNVSEILVEQGAFVSSISPLVKVIDNRHLHLILTVFEKDAVFLKEGQLVYFTLPEVSKERFTARILLVTSNIDEKRTVQVNAHLDNEENLNFLSGMFASAHIVIKSERGYALSESSVAETPEGVVALKLNEKTSEGYYFEKVLLPPSETFNGFVKIENPQESQFLKGKVFELIGG